MSPTHRWTAPILSPITRAGTLDPPAPPDLVDAPIAEPLEIGYNGGRLLTNVQVRTIFWGSPWAQAPWVQTAASLNNFFDYVLTSPFIEQLNEYGVPGSPIGPGRRTGTVTITDEDPVPGAIVTDAQIRANLLAWISGRKIPPPNDDTLYFIYTPPLVKVHLNGQLSCAAFCGYHDAVEGTPYAVIPDVECKGCLLSAGQLVTLTSVSSHELAEAITDPVPPTGWSTGPNEIADPCHGTAYALGGWGVQPLYSNARGACAPVPAMRPCTWATTRQWQQLDAFWIDLDGAVWTDEWTPFASWTAEPQAVAKAGEAQPSAVCALARWPWREEAFWIAPDGSVRTNWWDQSGGWNANPLGIAPAGEAQPGAIAAVAIRPWHMDVFWIGPDGSVRTNWFDETTNWNANPFNVAGPDQAQTGAVAVVPANPISYNTPQHLDVVWIAPDGSVRATWWDELKGWNANPVTIAGVNQAQPGAVSAAARGAGLIDVFWIGADGTVRTTSRGANGAWSNLVAVISGDMPAQPGTLASACRYPNRLDVFWLTPELQVVGSTSIAGAAWQQTIIGEVPGPAAPTTLGAVVRTAADSDVLWHTQGEGLSLVDGHQAHFNDPVTWSPPANFGTQGSPPPKPPGGVRPAPRHRL